MILHTVIGKVVAVPVIIIAVIIGALLNRYTYDRAFFGSNDFRRARKQAEKDAKARRKADREKYKHLNNRRK